MSLGVFENFLNFAEGAVRSKADLPASLDAVEFENALVNYGVVLLHSHMEQCMRRGIDSRLSRCLDPEACAFAVDKRKETTGRIKIEYLTKSLGRCSDSYKQVFREHLSKSGLGTSWDSVVNHRHTVAHEGQPASLTLADLRLYYAHIREVLGFFCDGLCLTSAEITAISPLIVRVTTSPPADPEPAFGDEAMDSLPPVLGVVVSPASE
jgi:hypothetical protein